MPENFTKYNKVPGYVYNMLQMDLSNNSYLYKNYHLLTCDISDTFISPLLPAGININQKNIYLENRAKTFMHPFSKIRNCVTQFNIQDQPGALPKKQNFLYKRPVRVTLYDECEENKNYIQKNIQNQNRVSSSEYSMNLASMSVGNNINGINSRGKFNASDRLTPRGEGRNRGVDIKHNSYDRYLNRKKTQTLKSDPSPQNIAAATNGHINFYGNKLQKFSIIDNCKRNC